MSTFPDADAGQYHVLAFDDTQPDSSPRCEKEP